MRDDCFLIDVVHLILELKLNDELIRKANMLSRESTPGVWDADSVLAL
jgi:hypothetical protein